MTPPTLDANAPAAVAFPQQTPKKYGPPKESAIPPADKITSNCPN